jgi:hypothetical protein
MNQRRGGLYCLQGVGHDRELFIFYVNELHSPLRRLFCFSGDRRYFLANVADDAVRQ